MEDEYLCPTCGSAMKLRVNSNNGSEFYGCSKYPRCKGIRNLDGSTGIGQRSGTSSDDALREGELPLQDDLPSERASRFDKRRWDY